MHERGATHAEIASLEGVTPQAVSKAIKRLNPNADLARQNRDPKPAWNRFDPPGLVADYERGATMQQLAARHGVSASTIHRCLKRHDAATRPRGTPQ